MVFKIAIIGAGPAGCMLARLLTHRAKNLDVTIFESEDSMDFRSQGGSLDLHTKTGQKALAEASLYELFLEHARFDSEAIALADKNLLYYLKVGGNAQGSTTGRPEIDRIHLRKILYNSLPENIVRWRHKLDHIGPDRILHFVDQPPQGGFDLIVGADGGWSKVRYALTTVRPHYSGIAGHILRIPNAAENVPELYDMVNRGSLFAWSDSKGIFSQYIGDGSVSVATWALRPSTWKEDCKYDVRDGKATKEACQRDYADWDSKLVAFTQQAEDDVVIRDLYMLPVGHRWEHTKGVTLVGDAAHLMGEFEIELTPFAGEGVNLAFEDCIKLADAITRSTSTSELDERVQAFEEDMFVRARAATQKTYDMMHAIFMTPGSPKTGIAKYLIKAAESEYGWWATRVLAPIVYAYFFLFGLLH